MMKINGVSASGNRMPIGTGMNTQEDAVSKSLKKQIEDAQERLQEISSSEDLSMEEKMKKRQEIQKEITTLNQQLRQHEIELRKEKQQEQKASNKEPRQTTKGGSMSSASMQAIISADTSLKQAQVQKSVSTRMEGRAGVLKAEIKQDKGKNTEAKEAELAQVEQKAADATQSQMETLGEANNAIKEAATAEPDNKKDETVTKTGKKTDEKTENKEQEQEKALEKEIPEKEVSEQKPDGEAVGTNVDVRL